jgi:hypothetical protein
MPVRDGFVVRRRLAWVLTTLGLVLYNWWLILLWRPSLLRSPNELFSNLEVANQPFASWLQAADVASGLLLLSAFLVLGWRSRSGGELEFALLLVFATLGAVGGLFPEQCLDSVSRSCHVDAVTFRLGYNQYFHMVTGILEFAAITTVLYLSYRRTRSETSHVARLYRWLVVGALIGYPLFAVAYLWVIGGSGIEIAFFIGISLVVVAQVRERSAPGVREGAAPPPSSFVDEPSENPRPS